MSSIPAPKPATRPATAAPVHEAEAFLAAHPDIEAFELLLVDPNGILRGKIIRRHEVLAVYRSGRHLPGSILGLDVTGEDVPDTGLVWDDGDADRCAWPVAGSLVALPYAARGQFIVALHELDGRPVAADPRHVLQATVERLERRGFTPVAAFELEFYLLEADGLNPAPLPMTGRQTSGIHVYSVTELVRLQPFAEELYRAAHALGLPVETLISEYAPGQFELTLRHGGVVEAATHLIRLKHLIRSLAELRGMRACFMAKPFGDRAGSGMHCHVSLANDAGENLFADVDGALSPALLNGIGGLMQTLADSMLIFAPTHNSWFRFSAQSYAPTVANWGINNRGVAIRVPAGAAASRHLEQRMAGVDANPYLVATVTLAGILHGIDHQCDPGTPASGDGSDGTRGPVPPQGWLQAMDRAQSSAFLHEALGPVMHRVFLALKRAEAARFATYISPLDYQLYLDTI